MKNFSESFDYWNYLGDVECGAFSEDIITTAREQINLYGLVEQNIGALGRIWYACVTNKALATYDQIKSVERQLQASPFAQAFQAAHTATAPRDKSP